MQSSPIWHTEWLAENIHTFASAVYITLTTKYKIVLFYYFHNFEYKHLSLFQISIVGITHPRCSRLLHEYEILILSWSCYRWWSEAIYNRRTNEVLTMVIRTPPNSYSCLEFLPFENLKFKCYLKYYFVNMIYAIRFDII